MKFLYDFNLFEAISLSDARKATELFLKNKGKERYNEFFKGKDRLYYDFIPDSEKPKSELINSIEAELNKNGYSIENYYEGTAKKEGDIKNIFKIQRLLMRWDRKDLKDQMDADPIRSGAKAKIKKIVISRHGIDLAGISTGRGWTSCKNLVGGINSRYVWSEIEAGSLVAYLIEENDINIQNPISRISIEVFVNEKDPTKILLYPETNGGYGNYGGKDFSEFVIQWVKGLNKHLNPTEGIYKIDPRCYIDTGMIPIDYSERSQNMGNIEYVLNKERGKGIIEYDKESKEYFIKDLYKYILDSKSTEVQIGEYLEIIYKKGFKNLLINYINDESNEQTTSFFDKNPRMLSTIIKSLENYIIEINDEKSKLISQKFFNSLNQLSKENLFKINSKDPFLLWFRDNVKKFNLINPDFKNIDQ
jgi:hypothetical protein